MLSAWGLVSQRCGSPPWKQKVTISIVYDSRSSEVLQSVREAIPPALREATVRSTCMKEICWRSCNEWILRAKRERRSVQCLLTCIDLVGTFLSGWSSGRTSGSRPAVLSRTMEPIRDGGHSAPETGWRALQFELAKLFGESKHPRIQQRFGAAPAGRLRYQPKRRRSRARQQGCQSVAKRNRAPAKLELRLHGVWSTEAPQDAHVLIGECWLDPSHAC